MEPPLGRTLTLAPLHPPDAAETQARYKTGDQRWDFGGGKKNVLGIFTHEEYDDDDDSHPCSYQGRGQGPLNTIHRESAAVSTTPVAYATPWPLTVVMCASSTEMILTPPPSMSSCESGRNCP